MTRPTTCLVLGAGGFIGHHLTKDLKARGCWVRGVDRKPPEFEKTPADDFVVGDLRNGGFVSRIFLAPDQTSLEDADHSFDEVYQLAAEMGGAGMVFSGEYDAEIIYNSTMINLHVAKAAADFRVKKLLFTSSACAYPEDTQLTTDSPNCHESTAFQGRPDSTYGIEKLVAEEVYDAFARNHGVDVRIVRLHNIFGPLGTWRGGREKAPAAICRKVAEAEQNGEVEIWGDGEQTRSFLYIDECIAALRRMMEQDTFKGPVNVGSTEMVSINELVAMVASVAGKTVRIRHVPGPLGVRGRNSHNAIIREKLGWEPDYPLRKGIEILYPWIQTMVNSGE